MNGWIIEPPRHPFAVSAQARNVAGVEHAHFIVYDTATGETMAETSHGWIADRIAADLSGVAPKDDSRRLRAVRDALSQRHTYPADVALARAIAKGTR